MSNGPTIQLPPSHSCVQERQIGKLEEGLDHVKSTLNELKGSIKENSSKTEVLNDKYTEMLNKLGQELVNMVALVRSHGELFKQTNHAIAETDATVDEHAMEVRKIESIITKVKDHDSRIVKHEHIVTKVKGIGLTIIALVFLLTMTIKFSAFVSAIKDLSDHFSGRTTTVKEKVEHVDKSKHNKPISPQVGRK